MKNLQLFSLGIAMLISLLTFGQDSSESEQAKQKTITGTVTDNVGPLPGVTVMKKGTSLGVSTDFNGNYSIKAIKGETLVFTFLGMCDVTKTVTDINLIDIIMQEDPIRLETVTLPYSPGIKKRTAQTISCGTTVSAEEIRLKPEPESKGIVFKCSRSVLENKDPLIVMDNKITSKMELEKIPREKIKSINILKGVQGATLYGSDGVNGVIIITTKDLSRKERRELKKQLKIESLKDKDSIKIR